MIPRPGSQERGRGRHRDERSQTTRTTRDARCSMPPTMRPALAHYSTAVLLHGSLGGLKHKRVFKSKRLLQASPTLLLALRKHRLHHCASMAYTTARAWPTRLLALLHPCTTRYKHINRQKNESLERIVRVSNVAYVGKVSKGQN